MKYISNFDTHGEIQMIKRTNIIFDPRFVFSNGTLEASTIKTNETRMHENHLKQLLGNREALKSF